jgi:hypothetical protein
MRTCLPKPRRRQVESRWGLPQKPKLESLNSGIRNLGNIRNLGPSRWWWAIEPVMIVHV